jgi:predicted PurR-regulated permease PerM
MDSQTAERLLPPSPPAPAAAARDPHEPAAVMRMRVLWWSAVSVATGLLVWLLSPVLTPFVVGAAMGYFLDPMVCRLERRGVPRAVAAAAMIVSLMAVLVVGLVVLVPVLAGEAATLLRALPGLYEDAQRLIARQVPALDPSDENGPVGQALGKLGETLTEASPTLFGGVLSGVTSLFRVLLFWIVMPVVAFYLLMDWQRLLQAIDDLLPRDRVHTVRKLAREIDVALAGYVRGVVVVCTILAVYYAATLTMAGLTYGLLVGVIAGAISFIPYVGAFVGGALAIGLALYQFWGDPILIGVVAAIFALGQILESQILVPRLVGSSVNLHPVWLIFAVMAFGSVFGFFGAVVAVPLAAALGVLVRHAAESYRESRLYEGRTQLATG